MKPEQIKALNERYIGPAPQEISPAKLRDIVKEHKDDGYHRECLQAANVIERLQRELKEVTK